MSILARIKELCKERNTTVAGLEDELGFGRSTIVRWDECSPTAAKLIAVADYFNVSLDYLARGKEHGANIT